MLKTTRDLRNTNPGEAPKPNHGGRSRVRLLGPKSRSQLKGVTQLQRQSNVRSQRSTLKAHEVFVSGR